MLRATRACVGDGACCCRHRRVAADGRRRRLAARRRRVPVPSTLAGRAALLHAFLMICGFMGTVIGIERAVAVKQRARLRWRRSPPASPGAAHAGWAPDGRARWLAVLAAASPSSPSTCWSCAGSERRTPRCCWPARSPGWSATCCLRWRGSGAAVVPWWFAFLVLTIAAERLEMTRLMRRRPGAAGDAGRRASAHAARRRRIRRGRRVAGGVLYGASLSALALWLLRLRHRPPHACAPTA